MAGELDSPLYGLFDISGTHERRRELEQWFLDQPPNPYDYSLKWDGEWQVTYETFRDMGAAYGVGLILIYLLVVAQFAPILSRWSSWRRYPADHYRDHARTCSAWRPVHCNIHDRHDRACRNYCAELDSARRFHQSAGRRDGFNEAVILAAVRAQPIVLTALAAMAGGFFILDDPIFSGLAVSLIFGLLISTILTLVVIPVVYFAAMQNNLSKINGIGQDG